MLRPLILFVFPVILLLNSCTSRSLDLNDNLKSVKLRYKQTEVSGEYIVNTKSGFGKDKEYIRKNELVSPQNTNEIFEKTIVITKKKQISKDVYFLVPYKYESTYFLNKEPYTVSGLVDLKNRKVIYSLNSPEFKWLGQKEYMIPKEVKVMCFYSTLIECGKVSGFIRKSIEKKNGDMTFHVLWESYPYFQEQYLNMPKEIISLAELSFDGSTEKGDYRFLLSVGGQSQVYLLNKRLELVGHYWTAQGLSKELIK